MSSSSTASEPLAKRRRCEKGLQDWLQHLGFFTLPSSASSSSSSSKTAAAAAIAATTATATTTTATAATTTTATTTTAATATPAAAVPSALSRPLLLATDCGGALGPAAALADLGVAFRHIFTCEVERSNQQLLHALPREQRPEIVFTNMPGRSGGGYCVFSEQWLPIPKVQADLYVANAGTHGPNPDRFFSAVKYIREYRPKVVILEDLVAACKEDHSGNLAADAIMALLEQSGPYEVDGFCLNAADFGLPQRRHRVYYVMVLKEHLKSSQDVQRDDPCGLIRSNLEKLRLHCRGAAGSAEDLLISSMARNGGASSSRSRATTGTGTTGAAKTSTAATAVTATATATTATATAVTATTTATTATATAATATAAVTAETSEEGVLHPGIQAVQGLLAMTADTESAHQRFRLDLGLSEEDNSYFKIAGESLSREFRTFREADLCQIHWLRAKKSGKEIRFVSLSSEAYRATVSFSGEVPPLASGVRFWSYRLQRVTRGRDMFVLQGFRPDEWNFQDPSVENVSEASLCRAACVAMNVNLIAALLASVLSAINFDTDVKAADVHRIRQSLTSESEEGFSEESTQDRGPQTVGLEDLRSSYAAIRRRLYGLRHKAALGA